MLLAQRLGGLARRIKQANNAAGARASPSQRICLAFTPTHGGQLLEHTTLGCVCKACGDCTRGCTHAADLWGHPRRRHLAHAVGTIHPGAVGLPGVNRARRDIRTPQGPRPILMKKRPRPAQPIPPHAGACWGVDLLPGQGRAATIRSLFGVRAPAVACPAGAQSAPRVASANVQARTGGTRRQAPSGVPLPPARLATARGQVAPGSCRGRRPVARCRGDTPGVPPGTHASPTVGTAGRLERVVLSATIRPPAPVPSSRGTKRPRHVERVESMPPTGMRGVIGTLLRQAVWRASVGAGRKWPEPVSEASDALGPGLTADAPRALLDVLTGVRMDTGARVERAVPPPRQLPGPPRPGVQPLRTWLGWLLGAVRSRRERHVGLVCQHLAAWGWVASRHAGGVLARVLPGDDHPQAPRTDTHVCQTGADRDPTRDPGRQGVSRQGAAPGAPLRRAQRHARSRHPGDGSPRPCTRRQPGATRHRLPGLQTRWGEAAINAARSGRGDATGRSNLAFLRRARCPHRCRLRSLC